MQPVLSKEVVDSLVSTKGQYLIAMQPVMSREAVGLYIIIVEQY